MTMFAVSVLRRMEDLFDKTSDYVKVRNCH